MSRGARLQLRDRLFFTIMGASCSAVCQMDRVIIATAKQQIDAKAPAFDALPCDILRAAALPCPYAPPRENATSA